MRQHQPNAGGPEDRGHRVLRLILPLLMAGVTVGAAVTAMAAFFGVASCSESAVLAPVDVGSACEDLVRTLSIRTGAVAGVATVLFIMLTVGLLKMVARTDEDRHVRAVERYREGRPQA